MKSRKQNSIPNRSQGSTGKPRSRGERGTPMYHAQVKVSFNVKLQPRTIETLTQKSAELSISRSEILEKLVNDHINHLAIHAESPDQDPNHP